MIQHSLRVCAPSHLCDFNNTCETYIYVSHLEWDSLVVRRKHVFHYIIKSLISRSVCTHCNKFQSTNAISCSNQACRRRVNVIDYTIMCSISETNWYFKPITGQVKWPWFLCLMKIDFFGEQDKCVNVREMNVVYGALKGNFFAVDLCSVITKGISS